MCGRITEKIASTTTVKHQEVNKWWQMNRGVIILIIFQSINTTILMKISVCYLTMPLSLETSTNPFTKNKKSSAPLPPFNITLIIVPSLLFTQFLLPLTQSNLFYSSNSLSKISHLLFKMNIHGTSSSGTATRMRQTFLPPGATRPATSSASRHPLPSLAAVMSSPERRNMPLLHPERLNGGLWFSIDDCIRKDVVATYQSNFWGPWWNYNMVPQEKKDAWWTSFVQKYYWDPQHHSEVRAHWEKIHQDSIRDLVSKRRRSEAKKKPDFIGLADWNMMLEIWEEEPHQKRSKTNSKNATSNPDGLGTHRHTSGSKNHTRIAYDMTVEAGGVAPALTELVRKTHTSKNGTCIDKRAEAYVKAAESLALERSESATATGETASAPSTQQLNAAYIEMATNTKGRVYGLGSLQYVDAEPKESPAASLRRSVGVDGRLTTVEGVVTGLKDDVSGLKQSIDLLLKMNGVDPVTHQPIPRESGASAPSPHSDASQELNQHSPTH